MSICSGNELSTGYGIVGPRTRVKIQSMCNNGKNATAATSSNTQKYNTTVNKTTSWSGYNPSQNNTNQSVVAAEYNFEGTGTVVIDSSGNGNNGILENGATRYQGTRSGKKLLLDGVDDRVKVYSKSSLNNMNQFTLSAWIRPEKFPGIIIRKGNTDKARFNFGLTPSGQLYLRVGHSIRTGVWETNSANIPLNRWTHVAVTYNNNTKTARFYVNGNEIPAYTTTITSPQGTIQADTPYMYIGNNHDLANRAYSGTSAFKGRMDKIYIYNKVLTNFEIKGIAAVPAGPVEVPITD